MPLRACVYTLIAVLVALPAIAADPYPNRTVQVIEPTPPGGGADLVARLLAQQLSVQTKQQFVVDNRGGAGGLLGARLAADAKPDGYTLLLAASAMTIAPFMTATQTLDPEHELTPITEVAYGAFVMVVNPSVPVKTPTELVAYAKAHPKEFRWAGVPGSADSFTIAQFDKAAGMKSLLVPYNGSGPALIAMLGGDISAMVIVPPLVKDHIAAGKLRALAVTSKDPSEFAPGVPTVASFGYPGFDAGLWYGLWGPKGLPKEIASELQQQVQRALTAPDIQAKFKINGLVPDGTKTPDAFAAYASAEVKKNKAIIDENGLRAKE
jgi:tripartite-type tricarboxylate transporter receptor subunit TctC